MVLAAAAKNTDTGVSTHELISAMSLERVLDAISCSHGSFSFQKDFEEGKESDAV